MSMPAVDAHLQTAVWMIIRVSVLLAAGAIVHGVLRRRTSAAMRHLIWTVTVIGLLLLPMLSAVLPGWKVPIRLMATTGPDARPTVERAELVSPFLTASDTGVSSPVVATSTASARTAGMAIDIGWSTALPALYAAGVLLLVARLIAEQVTIRRLARRATEVSEPELTRLLIECEQRTSVRRPVRLLRSREHTMPMVFGTRAPAIVLPAVADTWSRDRCRAVLLHELAHVARYDCLTQMAAALACAVYWIHPGVWWVARRLRVERELACDDRVLTAGTHAGEYAGHLLELAYSLGGHRTPALAASMARPRQLEGRMLAVLDTARNRATPSLRGRLAGIAVMAALLAPLAGAEAVAVPAGAASQKVVRLADRTDEGPTVVIQSIEFVGNQAISSGTLRRQMRTNKAGSIWTRMFSGRSTYQERKISEDAENIVGYYRDHGYLTARVGAPELTVVRDSSDMNTRFVDLRIPVVEGHRYRVGELSFDGNTVVRSDDLRLMFRVERGAYYSDQTIREGLMKAREAYGAGGYFEFTGYPDYKLRDLLYPAEPDTPEVLKAESSQPATGPAIVDITVRLQEGTQYFVNRLTFTGNTRRPESVIRREVRLVEGGVFDTEALKDSIKRLNRLGYFKPIAGGTRGVDIQKTPGENNRVDVKLRLEDR
jgi:beta-lactamase regulating signal transducer with metallopeptidase domain